MDFFKYFKRKEEKKADTELKTATTTYADTRPSTEPKKAPARRMTMREMKINKGYGMLTPAGNYMSPHDIRCLELMGCDLEVLAALRTGEIPDCAPHGNGPHQLSAEYAELKAKEREENAKEQTKILGEQATAVMHDEVAATA